MQRVFRTIRKPERRDAWTAFALLFGLIASHAVLETARDALFLSKIPASRLPWMYMAIAVVTLALAQGQAAIASRMSGRAALSAWVAGASLITGVFWLFMDLMGIVGLYALYVWSGTLTTLVLVHFWTLLGDIFTITQAKRLYGFIGAGSVLGAISGSGLASALSRLIPPSELLLIAAAGLGLTSLLPMLMRSAESAGAAPDKTRARILDSARFVIRKRYATWVALFVAVSTAALTFGDYLFKSTVAAHLTTAAELSAFFATTYFALNLLSLGTQLFLIGWLLRKHDIGKALALLPLLLLVGAGSVFILPLLWAATILVKGPDGSLRYSVHRTATELLYVPFSDHGRRLVKGFIDVVGQRGGQAVASVAILAVTALTAEPKVLAIMLAIAAAAWALCARRVYRHYLELFRNRVQRGQIEHIDEFPDLDLASLENIVAALDSKNVEEVLAALEILEREGRDNLIPALTLYHPSETIVLRALTIIARAKRTRAAHATEHLLDHQSPRVRAAAAAAFSILTDDEQALRMRLSIEESPAVRATIRVNLIASGALVGSDATDSIRSLIAHGATEVKIAMAQAIAWRQASGYEELLVSLAGAIEPEVRLAAVEAMARLDSDLLRSTLVDLLGHESTRRAAINGLVDHGGPGLEALRRALADHQLTPVVRWHLPEALRAFPPEDAIPVMLLALPEEPDGMVRYRLIRALEGLYNNAPGLRLAREANEALDRAIRDTISRAYRYLDRRLILEAGANDDPARNTAGHDLLITSLRDKQEHAIDRLFRLLGLEHPTEGFSRIYRVLENEQERASSLELIENILVPRRRQAVLGLVEDLPDHERLPAGSEYHTPLQIGYNELLAQMLKSESDTVKSVTVYHVGELGLGEFRDRIAQLKDDGVSRSDVALALEILDGQPAAPVSSGQEP